MSMTLDEAIVLLKKAVKWSEVKNQKHIDLSVCLPKTARFFKKH